MEIEKTSAAYKKILAAAEMVAASAGSADQFLDNCIYHGYCQHEWCIDRTDPKKDDHSFTLSHFMRQVIPCIYSISPDRMENLAWALKEVVEWSAPDGFRLLVNQLVASFGKNTDGSDWFSDALQKHLSFLCMLNALAICFEEYDALLDEEKEKLAA